MNGDVRKELKRIQNLKQNKDRSDSELEHLAKLNLKERDFKKNPIFQDEKDQDLAEKKFKSYITDYQFENLSDIDTLRSLLFTEILEIKLQQRIEIKISDDSKNISEFDTRQLKDVQNQIISLKIKLGISKEEGDVDELSGLDVLKKRYETYIQQNKNEFTIYCKHCAKPLLLRRRVKDFEVYKHPWFAGRWLFNYEILKDVKEEKLDKKTAWRYLCAASNSIDHQGKDDESYSIDYINYCLDNWDDIVEHLNN